MVYSSYLQSQRAARLRWVATLASTVAQTIAGIRRLSPAQKCLVAERGLSARKSYTDGVLGWTCYFLDHDTILRPLLKLQLIVNVP